MQIFKYLAISLLIGIAGIYSTVQAMEDSRVQASLNKEAVKKCLRDNAEKSLREIASISEYSFEILYEVYKEMCSTQVREICEICDYKSVTDFYNWDSFMQHIRNKVPGATNISSQIVERILKKIDKEEYLKLKDVWYEDEDLT